MGNELRVCDKARLWKNMSFLEEACELLQGDEKLEEDEQCFFHALVYSCHKEGSEEHNQGHYEVAVGL